MVRKNLFAAAIVAALVVSAAVPATAAEPDPAATYQLGDPVSVEAQFNYGAARGDSIPIGVDTTRVIIEPTETEATGSLRGPVVCTIYGAHSDSIEDADDRVPLGDSVTREWSVQEWADPAARFLDLPEGTIAVWPNRDADDYDRFDLYCESYEQDAARQVTRLLWRLTPYETVAPVVTLVEDPGIRFGDDVSSRYREGGPRRVLTTGQEVRVTGPAGTWPVIDPANGALGSIDAQLVTRTDEVALPASVNADRSTVTFLIPNLLGTVGAEEGAYISVRSYGSTASSGKSVTRIVTWQAPVTVNPAGLGMSKTSLTLSRYTVKWWRPTATVAVERAATTPAGTPWGSVRIVIDGEQYGPDVAVDKSGRAKVRLPYLEPGRHVVSASYRGDAETARSSSPAASVRVLF